MPNREALLESAITSLQERGYASTTARDVADGAGVSLGAIGYHYRTVQELLDAALAEAVRRWFEPLIGVLSRSQPPPTFEQLGPALDGLLDTLASHRPLVIAYFEALLRAERSPALRTALAADLDAFRQALKGGIQSLFAGQPESASPDPQAAASLVMATFDGLIIQWLLAPEHIPSGQLIADTLQRATTLANVHSESIDAV
ncbi:MAG: TetR/AcrR family transcriptional regulator [Actinomycetota bacterium]|nr:TetR/AcrR family transcriptional regulator [Actinomycetota bacterium]